MPPSSGLRQEAPVHVRTFYKQFAAYARLQVLAEDADRPDAGRNKTCLISYDPSIILLFHQFPIVTNRISYGNREGADLHSPH